MPQGLVLRYVGYERYGLYDGRQLTSERISVRLCKRSVLRGIRISVGIIIRIRLLSGRFFLRLSLGLLFLDRGQNFLLGDFFRHDFFLGGSLGRFFNRVCGYLLGYFFFRRRIYRLFRRNGLLDGLVGGLSYFKLGTELPVGHFAADFLEFVFGYKRGAPLPVATASLALLRI